MSKLGHSGSGNDSEPFKSFMEKIVAPPATGDAKPEQVPAEPTMCRVYLHNNPHTPHLTVIAVLRTVFELSERDANRLMMDVHNQGTQGRGLVGTYTKEIAEDKIRLAKESERSDIANLLPGAIWPLALEFSIEEVTE